MSAKPAPAPQAGPSGNFPVPCVWTDEELAALAGEADAEGGEPLDGETALQALLAQVRQQPAA